MKTPATHDTERTVIDASYAAIKQKLARENFPQSRHCYSLPLVLGDVPYV